MSPAAIAAPWSPKVCGTARRSSWPPSEGGPVGAPARPRDRAVGDVAAGRGPGGRCGPSIHTCTRSPLASPGASSTIAAAEREGREALQEPAQPGVAEGAAVRRDEQVGALVAGGGRRLRQPQQHGGRGRAGRDPGGRVARGDHQDAAARAAVGGAGDARRTRSAGSRARRRRGPRGPGAAPGRRRPAPGRAGPAPSGPPARSSADPGGRSGAMAASCCASSSVPWPSIVDGSAASGPASGVCRVSRATTSATPATSQEVRYRRRFSTAADPRRAGGGA